MTGFLRRIYGFRLPRQKVVFTDPFIKWREVLVEKMNPDSGILERLLDEKILVEQEVDKIKGKGTTRERNSKIVEYVTRRKKFKEFLKVIEETDQELSDLIAQLDTKENVSNHRFARTVSKDRKTKKNKPHKLRKSNKKKKHKVVTSKTLNDLPAVGVLDPILMKAILIATSNRDGMSLTRREHAREAASRLQCVQSTWNDLVNAKRFKMTFRRLLERPVCRLQKRIYIADDWVYGVTKLRRTIYILCQWSKSIRMYDDTNPFQLHGEIHLDGIRRPCDLAASDKNECLYVSDSLCKCIWKVDLNERMIVDVQRTTLWLDNTSSPFTLSVTRDGRVVMVTWGRPESGLDIYGPEATSICHVTLPADVECPLHAVESSVGNLIVSHRWSNSWTWTISEVSVDGQLVRRFDPMDKRFLLNWPRHLAIDCDDRLFVSDCENDRVILVDSKLNACRTLLARGVARIARPDRILYDARNGQLIVAHFEGQVDICHFM